jgi:redox-sensing transcriptional repressor
VSSAAIRRTHTYSLILDHLAVTGQSSVSSDELGRRSGTTAALVRSDLMAVGFRGTRGVGYDVEALRLRLARVLGTGRSRHVVIVGAGRLGAALASYLSQVGRGLRVAAVFDNAPGKIGIEVAGLRVASVLDLPTHDLSDVLAVITTPPSSAQEVADALVAAGARAILSFAPVGIDVPEPVILRHVDLAGELYVLSFFSSEGAGNAAP